MNYTAISACSLNASIERRLFYYNLGKLGSFLLIVLMTVFSHAVRAQLQKTDYAAKEKKVRSLNEKNVSSTGMLYKPRVTKGKLLKTFNYKADTVHLDSLKTTRRNNDFPHSLPIGIQQAVPVQSRWRED